ncbi:hypothetical protein, partial [Nocardia farcinica]|uniref:hypothetical protein n=1 Tax=Nocardia farcinica TaxID=37329 RepID=UPI00245804CF
KTNGLRGLPVLRSSGLGGRVMDLRRPVPPRGPALPSAIGWMRCRIARMDFGGDPATCHPRFGVRHRRRDAPADRVHQIGFCP